MQNEKPKTIFVLIASFRDPECEKTINQLFSKASNPQNIFVGVFWQYSLDDNFKCFDSNHPYKKNIKYQDILYKESKGVCWARNIAQNFYKNQDYILIIDSHMLFDENWDSFFIDEINACPSNKSILSCYPAGYSLPEKKSNIPLITNAAHSRRNRYQKDISHPYSIRGNMFQFQRNIELDKPIKSFFYAAGFAFGPAEFLKDVPYDYLLDWEEEEIAISLKLWTHGWDIYAPRKHTIYHLYHERKPSDKTPYFRNAVSHAAQERRADISKKRFQHLLNFQKTHDRYALENINKYSFGNKRNISSFERAAGVQFSTNSVSERSIDCWFALDTKSHPLRFSCKNRLKNVFTEMYENAKKHQISNEESISGLGSSLSATKILRENLINLIEEYQIESILDLGCGDALWIKEVLKNSHLRKYTGIDIVDDLITINSDQEKNKIVDYSIKDVTTEQLGIYDLVLVRDVLTHLKARNIIKVLSNIKNSNSKYLLVSHYTKADRYRDLLRDGRWHVVNLEIPPFNFPTPVKIIGDIPEKGKFLALWDINDIPKNSFTSMEINYLNSDSYYSIGSFLSKDECAYISSWKYYKNLDNKTRICNISQYDQVENPIIKRVIDRLVFFSSTPDYFNNLFVIELDSWNELSIKNKNRATIVLAILNSNSDSISILFKTTGEAYKQFSLSPENSIVFSKEVINDVSIKISDQNSENNFLLLNIVTEEKIDNTNIGTEIALKKLNNPSSNDQIHMTLAGDLILSRRMHNKYALSTSKNILGDFYDVLKDSDLNLCNLETVISNRGSMYKKGERNPYYYRASTTLANFLLESNINIVTTGNNHTLDFGDLALLDQKKFLLRNNIANSGSGKDIVEAMEPAYIHIKDTTIALISFCSVRPKTLCATKQSAGIFQINNIDLIAHTLKPIISVCKEKADLIIVSPHWIENWESKPNSIIRDQAHALIDSGCDAIFGHSSHLLIGMEIYKNKPIVYDMGTILVDNISGHDDLKFSALFELLIEKKQISKLTINPARLQHGTVNRSNNHDSRITFDRLKSLPDNNFNTLDNYISNNQLIFNFPINPNYHKKLKNQHPIFNLNSTKIKTESIFRKDVLLSKAPQWNTRFTPINFDNNFQIIDVKSVESCSIGAGFKLKVAFKVGQPLHSNYEIHLKGISQLYHSEFNEYHTVSNGIIDTSEWVNGKILIDYHFIRLNRNIKAGIYDIFWGLYDQKNDQYILTKTNKTHALISSIYILPSGINPLASGVDWNGNISNKIKHKFNVEFMVDPEIFFINYIQNILIQEDFSTETYSIDAIEQKYNFTKNSSLVFLSINIPGSKAIRWGSTRKRLNECIHRNIEKIKLHPLFHVYKLNQKNILNFELITAEKELDLNTESKETYIRHGLIIQTETNSYIILPSECKSRSLSSTEEKITYLKLNNNISVDNSTKYIVLESIVISKENNVIKIDKYN